MNQKSTIYKEGFQQAAQMIYYHISLIPATQLTLKSIEDTIEKILRQQDSPRYFN